MIYKKNKINKISYIFLFVCLTFWFLLISSMHIYSYPPDVLFYEKQLPIFYWIGISLAITLFLLVFFLKLESKIIIGMLIFIIILYLFGLPSFVYTNTRYLDVYATSGIIDKVIQTGDLSSPDPRDISTMYRTQYLASIAFYSMASEIINQNILVLAKYYPIYLILMISIMLYCCSRALIGKYAFIAPIAYLSCAWVQEYHLSPQAHAIILTGCFWFLTIMAINHFKKLTELKFLLIVVWLAIVTTHALTPILTLFCISIMFITFAVSEVALKYIKISKIENNSITKIIDILKTATYNQQSASTYVLVLVIIYIFYMLYSADYLFNRLVEMVYQIADMAVYGDDRFIIENRNVVMPSESYLNVYYVRLFSILGVLVFSIVFCLISLFSARKNKFNTNVFFIISLFLGYSSISFLLVSVGYNIYGPDRGFIFTLIPFSLMSSMILTDYLHLDNSCNNMYKYVKSALIVFIILGILLIPITRYSSDPYNFVSESEYHGINFFKKYEEATESNSEKQLNSYYNFKYNSYELRRLEGNLYKQKFENQSTIYDAGFSKLSIA